MSITGFAARPGTAVLPLGSLEDDRSEGDPELQFDLSEAVRSRVRASPAAIAAGVRAAGRQGGCGAPWWSAQAHFRR